jgi:hypothetical protein
MTYPASCLVYLFGDQFAPARRGLFGVEPLPWRGAAGIDARSLGQAVLAAALTSLAERRNIILAAGERREDGLILGVMLDTFRHTALVSRGPVALGPDDGQVEHKLLEQVQGRTPVYQVVKDMVPFGIEGWHLALRLAQADLVRRGALTLGPTSPPAPPVGGAVWRPRLTPNRGRWARWLGGRVRRETLMAGTDLTSLAVEAAEVRRTMDHFKATYPALHELIQAEIAAAFRQSLDRLW